MFQSTPKNWRGSQTDQILQGNSNLPSDYIEWYTPSNQLETNVQYIHPADPSHTSSSSAAMDGTKLEEFKFKNVNIVLSSECLISEYMLLELSLSSLSFSTPQPVGLSLSDSTTTIMVMDDMS